MSARERVLVAAGLLLVWLSAAPLAGAQTGAEAQMVQLQVERLRAAEVALLASERPRLEEMAVAASPTEEPKAVPGAMNARPAEFTPEAWQVLRQSFLAEGVPEELLWLGWVESRFNPRVVSPKGARGVWQLMPETARRLGLEVNAQRDERVVLLASTQAAARYLAELRRDYGDWLLVLAAYNAGPKRLEAALLRAGSRDFWRLQRWLPEETQRYVPAVLAAMGGWPPLSNSDSPHTVSEVTPGGERVFALPAPPVAVD